MLAFSAIVANHADVRLDLTAGLDSSELEARRLRKEAGRVACEATGVGPTGGFCLNHTSGKKACSSRHIYCGNNDCIANTMAAHFAVLYKNRSVLDLGCGVGSYGAYFHRHAPSVTWFGVDGAENVEEVTNGLVQWADLAEGLPQAVRHYTPGWDWVMSLEVAEHIPRSGEAVFMHNVFSLRPREGVILSWAQLGQGGTFHVNCQTEAYVHCAAGLLGWKPDHELMATLRAEVKRRGQCPWLANTLLVYRRAPDEMQMAQQHLELENAPPSSVFVEAFVRKTLKHCGYVSEGCTITNQSSVLP